MKRHTYSIMAAALLLAMGALLTTACSNEDTAIDNPTPTEGSGQTIQFTATLAPKSGDGAQTRAIKKGKDEGKEILNVAWAEGEQVAVYYQKSDDSYATATATVGTPNGDGSAPITASLPDAKGGPAKFVYPATLANTTGDIDEAALLSQNGILTGANGISTKFDAATAEGIITVSDSEASVSGTVTMENRVCILKITLGFDDGQAHSSNEPPLHGGTTLTINDGDGRTYTISSPYSDQSASGTSQIVYRPFQTGDVIYVAMLPVDLRDVIFLSTASDNKHYEKKSTGVTLEKGKFYRNVNVLLTEVQLLAGEKDLSTGSITAENGDRIIQSSGTSTANTITIPDGATVTLDGVNISATETAGIICEGTANIILRGTNTVTTTSWDNSSIQAGGSGTTLTIRGSGSLTATCVNGAGIGSGRGGSCGDITITGGTVEATGGNGAGIGSGDDGSCGNITITGGKVTATSVKGAGIGSGDDGSCGNITIKGGTVTATGGLGAGIGSGDSGSCTGITITGGTVTATGDLGAGIGSGNNGGSCGDITITNGVSSVTASKGAADCSIGRGHDGYCGKVTIGGKEYEDGDPYLTTSPLVYEP